MNGIILKVKLKALKLIVVRLVGRCRCIARKASARHKAFGGGGKAMPANTKEVNIVDVMRKWAKGVRLMIFNHLTNYWNIIPLAIHRDTRDIYI